MTVRAQFASRLSARQCFRGLLAAVALSCVAFGQQATEAQPFQQSALQQQALKELVQRAGEETSRFVEQFSDVKCTEQVTQEKLNPKGKVEARQESTYD